MQCDERALNLVSARTRVECGGVELSSVSLVCWGFATALNTTRYLGTEGGCCGCCKCDSRCCGDGRAEEMCCADQVPRARQGW